MQRRYPKISVGEDRIFTIDGPIWTSAGMSAGVDLALALVENNLGAEIARVIAKILVVYHRRAGGQSPQTIQRTVSALVERSIDPKPEPPFSTLQNSRSFNKTSSGVGVLTEENYDASSEH